jgi:hypothetical protein
MLELLFTTFAALITLVLTILGAFAISQVLRTNYLKNNPFVMFLIIAFLLAMVALITEVILFLLTFN